MKLATGGSLSTNLLTFHNILVLCALKQVLDHLHDVLNRLQVAPEPGVVLSVQTGSHTLAVISHLDVSEGNAVHACVEEPLLQLALLRHLLAEAQELVGALIVVCVGQVIVQEVRDLLDQGVARPGGAVLSVDVDFGKLLHELLARR